MDIKVSAIRLKKKWKKLQLDWKGRRDTIPIKYIIVANTMVLTKIYWNYYMNLVGLQKTRLIYSDQWSILEI